MKVREIKFEFSYTAQVKENDYVKASYSKTVELEPGEEETTAREDVVTDVVDFVAEKMSTLVKELV